MGCVLKEVTFFVSDVPFNKFASWLTFLVFALLKVRRDDCTNVYYILYMPYHKVHVMLLLMKTLSSEN